MVVHQVRVPLRPVGAAREPSDGATAPHPRPVGRIIGTPGRTRPADLRPLRHSRRHPPGPRLPGDTWSQTGDHLPLLPGSLRIAPGFDLGVKRILWLRRGVSWCRAGRSARRAALRGRGMLRPGRCCPHDSSAEVDQVRPRGPAPVRPRGVPRWRCAPYPSDRCRPRAPASGAVPPGEPPSALRTSMDPGRRDTPTRRRPAATERPVTMTRRSPRPSRRRAWGPPDPPRLRREAPRSLGLNCHDKPQKQ